MASFQSNALRTDLFSTLRSASHRGFGLCYLLLRNAKGFVWNHMHVYSTKRLLELNLRIKPKRRLVREVPQPLVVPEAINQMWSMDFMYDNLEDGASTGCSTY